MRYTWDLTPIGRCNQYFICKGKAREFSLLKEYNYTAYFVRDSGDSYTTTEFGDWTEGCLIITFKNGREVKELSSC